MSLLLVRHVHAGDRGAHDSDDRHRPVSATGLRQALALVDSFADRDIVAICSSPLLRCVQSVEPLAAAHGLPIEEASELAEGSPLDVVDRFLRQQHRRGEQLGGDVVLCSHGDVIGAAVRFLAEQGAVRGGERLCWEKAGTWLIEGTLDEPDASYLPPPPVGGP